MDASAAERHRVAAPQIDLAQLVVVLVHERFIFLAAYDEPEPLGAPHVATGAVFQAAEGALLVVGIERRAERGRRLPAEPERAHQSRRQVRRHELDVAHPMHQLEIGYQHPEQLAGRDPAPVPHGTQAHGLPARQGRAEAAPHADAREQAGHAAHHLAALLPHEIERLPAPRARQRLDPAASLGHAVVPEARDQSVPVIALVRRRLAQARQPAFGARGRGPHGRGAADRRGRGGLVRGTGQ